MHSRTLNIKIMKLQNIGLLFLTKNARKYKQFTGRNIHLFFTVFFIVGPSPCIVGSFSWGLQEDNSKCTLCLPYILLSTLHIILKLEVHINKLSITTYPRLMTQENHTFFKIRNRGIFIPAIASFIHNYRHLAVSDCQLYVVLALCYDCAEFLPF